MNSPRQATGRRERRKERTRRAILDAALALLVERGLYGTRVEDITERADLGKGAFYNYFSSKDGLIAELLTQATGELERYLDGVDRTGAPARRVGALVEQHERFFDDHPEYLLLFHQARGLLHLTHQPVGPLQAVFTTYLQGIARRLVPQGQAAGSDAALDLAAVVAGSISGYRSFRTAANLSPRGTALVEVLVAGISARQDHAAVRG